MSAMDGFGSALMEHKIRTQLCRDAQWALLCIMKIQTKDTYCCSVWNSMYRELQKHEKAVHLDHLDCALVGIFEPANPPDIKHLDDKDALAIAAPQLGRYLHKLKFFLLDVEMNFATSYGRYSPWENDMGVMRMDIDRLLESLP